MQSAAHVRSASEHAALAARRRVAPRVVPRPRLKLGRANDEAELQADRIAAQVLKAPARATGPPAAKPAGGAAAVRRALATGEAADASHEDAMLPEALEERLLALQAGGAPLPEDVRVDMEARFGIDLGAVRIHTDGEAAQLSDAVGAHAFALGDHIAFNEGRFAPEQPAGKQLLAHELAHVAQHRAQAGTVEQAPVRRGFWGDLYDSVADTLGDIAEWGMDKVREFGWKLVRSISPELERTLRSILDEGILPWLGRQVARAWDVYIATLKALVPFEGPRQLIDLFAGMVERAAAIVAALASGNCEPLMAAIAEMKAFVVETVGVAWDKLTEFLRPIGEFFSELWANFGAPAVQWLKDFGGAVWEGIQELGRRFWEWIRPVREAAERVWNWFHDMLFGPSEGDEAGSSQGGVVGWISRKAFDAWDWVKERTRPVWQPVADFAGKVAELIPPAFIRDIGERAQKLSAELDGAEDGLEGGEGVPENRDTLASVLPSVEKIIATVRGILVGAGQWLASRVGAIAGVISGLIGRLNANSLLSWLGGALSWLSELIDTLAEWARDKVNTLFNWLVGAFDYLTPFFELVLNTVKKVITIYGDLIQLPLLVLNSIWKKVPACIREPIENFVQTQILARIPVFGQFFSDPEWWPKLKQTAMRLLRRIFVDGDILGVAWDFFKEVLRLMGLPPELVVQVLAKALRAIGDILVNPIGFLINLLKAMGKGFLNFFKNIGKHLLGGITGWLFGAAREAGIEPPADFSLGSVFRFVLDVLGLTVANVFERLKRKLDPAIVEKLKKTLEVATGVWSFVSILMTEGVAGLWRVLKEKIGNLWTTVIEGIMSFVTTRVIAWASLWLASLLDWTGITATITTLLAIWRAIQAAIEYLKQMLEIVARFLDGVIAIAAGAIDSAASHLEDALARSLPVAIGFLAYQAGIGRLSAKLREILSAIRERIDAAIDWVIDKALKLGKAVIDGIRRGVAGAKEAARRVGAWAARLLGLSASFTTAKGERHKLFFEERGDNVVLMMASERQTYRQAIQDIHVTPQMEAKKQAAHDKAEEIDAMIRSNKSSSRTAAGTKDQTPEFEALLRQLSDLTRDLMGSDNLPVTPLPTYGGLQDGYASSMEVSPLTRHGVPGTGVEVDSKGYRDLLKRKETASPSSRSYYVAGHLLNNNLHGSGKTWQNLTPITQGTNRKHLDDVEHEVKRAVDRGEVIRYSVSVNYGRSLANNQRLRQILQGRNPSGTLSPADQELDEILVAEQKIPDTFTPHVKRIVNYRASNEREEDLPGVANRPITNAVEDDSLNDYKVSGTPYNKQDEFDALKGEATLALRDEKTGTPVPTTVLWGSFKAARAGRIARLAEEDSESVAALKEIFDTHNEAIELEAENDRAGRQDGLLTWKAFQGGRAIYEQVAEDDTRVTEIKSAFDGAMKSVSRGIEARIGRLARLSEIDSWEAFKTEMAIGRAETEIQRRLKGAFDRKLLQLLLDDINGTLPQVAWSNSTHRRLAEMLSGTADKARVQQAYDTRRRDGSTAQTEASDSTTNSDDSQEEQT